MKIGDAKIPYYVVKGDRAYWQPNKKLKAMGAQPQPLGPPGDAAITKAQELTLYWRSNGTAMAKRADRVAGYVYFLMTRELVKIGFSTDPVHRLAELKTAIGDGVPIFCAVEGTLRDEKDLHDRLAFHRAEGEWFRLTPPVRQMIARIVVGGSLRRHETATELEIFPTGTAA